MGAHPTRCPSAGELERLLADDLTGPTRDEVETHVETCPRCQDELARLSATDFHAAIPLVAAPAGPDPEPAADFLSRLRQLPAPGRTTTSHNTRFPGGRVGRYEVLDKLAVGGMGVVYKARHLDMGKVVALKVLPAGAGGELHLERFRNEMRAMGRVRHPNVVVAHDAGEADGTHYLAMEFVDGADLARLVRRHGRLPVADACEAVRQAALGLQHAHECGLVHRDVKPSNLMLSRSGLVQVLDLGLARAATEPPSERLTATGALLGTADYLAPEQWDRPHAADIRADIYSLGCTLYHLLAGRPPFAGDRYVTAMSKMRAHHEDPPPPVADLPPGPAAVLDRMLAKDPADRSQTPGEVARALGPFAAGADLARLLDDETGSLPPAEAAVTPGPANRETSAGTGRRPAPRRGRYRVPATVAVVALLAVAAWFWWPKGQPLAGPAGPAAGPVTVDEFAVRHFRGRQSKDLGDLATSEPVRKGDDVRVTARFNRPAHCYLIALNPDGSEQLCHPAFDGNDALARTVRPAAVEEVKFFPEQDVYFNLDQAGLQVFVLIASADPLPPYAEWRANVDRLPWRAVYHGGETRWRFDGRDTTPLAPARGTRQERDPVPAALRELTDFFKGRSGPEVVRAVAFPVTVDDKAWQFKAVELDLAREGQYAEAIKPVEELVKLHVGAKGDRHWLTADARAELEAIRKVAALADAERAEYTRGLLKLDRSTVLYKEGRYPEALPLAKDALDLFRKHFGPDHRVTVDVAIQYGVLLREAARLPEAETVFRDALAAIEKVAQEAGIGDHPTAAVVTLGLSLILDRRDKPKEAKELLDRALALATRLHGADHADTAVVVNNLAAHFDRLGDHAEAEKHYRRALEVLLRAEGAEGVAAARTRDNLGYNLTHQGKLKEGEEHHREALRVRRLILPPGHPDVATTLNNLAANLDQQGRHAEAEDHYRTALDFYRKRFGPEGAIAAMTGNNLALNLQHQGKHEPAVPLFEAALRVYEGAGLGRSRGAAVIHNNLASARQAQGRTEEALTHARTAHDIHREVLGDGHPETAQCLNNVAVVLEALKKHAEAEGMFREAAAVLEKRVGKDHPHTALAAANLAVYLSKRGKYAEAAPGLAEAVAAHQKLLGHGHPRTAWAYRNLVANHWARGEYKEAAALGPAALASFEAARQRLAFAGLDRARKTDEINPLSYLAASAARTGQAREAWRYLEAGLARGLLDDLAARPLTDAERAREKQLLLDLDRLDRRVAAAGPDSPDRDAPHRERDEARGRFVRFQTELADRYGVAAGKVLDLAAVQKTLPADAALIAWLDLEGRPTLADPAGDHWACVIRSKGDPVWVQLPADAKAPTLARRRLISRTGGTDEEWADAAARLHKQRLAPVEAALAGIRHLVVVPSGDMVRIPVEALTDKFTVSYAPSGTTFADRHGPRPAPAGEPTLVAVGDPAAEGGGAPVPGTRTEVQAIARRFARPTVLLGAEASEASLDRLAASGELGRSRFLHFATHGEPDNRRPLASELVLAGGGRLSAERVLRTWKLRADLVTLSACDTGRGTYVDGEGYLGFAHALLLAGARACVVSLWDVDDRATTLLMTRFYENLLAGHGTTTAGALAEAKRWLRDLSAAEVDRLDRELPGGLPAGTPRGTRRPADPPAGGAPRPFAHPHYWAAFVLIGDSR